MKTKIISTKHAPAAVGPYSQAIRFGNLIFTAGQIALNPLTGKMIAGDITDQTDQVLTNLNAVLQAANSGFKNVVKTTVFLQSMNDFAQFNAAYARHFGDHKPARSTVEVAALPLGGLVEIEAIATVNV